MEVNCLHYLINIVSHCRAEINAFDAHCFGWVMLLKRYLLGRYWVVGSNYNNSLQAYRIKDKEVRRKNRVLLLNWQASSSKLQPTNKNRTKKYTASRNNSLLPTSDLVILQTAKIWWYWHQQKPILGTWGWRRNRGNVKATHQQKVSIYLFVCLFVKIWGHWLRPIFKLTKKYTQQMWQPSKFVTFLDTLHKKSD